MRLRSQIAALCLAALAAPAAARTFSVDDLLNAEEFGQMAFTPDGGHLVFERLAGQAASGPFDQDVASGYRRGRIYVADVKAGGPALPLTRPSEGPGQVAGPLSPDGRRMAILRFREGAFDLGVATLATGEVRWLNVTPELGWLGQTLAWRTDDELIVATRPTDDPPLRLRTGADWRGALPKLWAQARSGDRPAVSLVGSGRFLSARPATPAGELIAIEVASGSVRRLAKGEFYDLQVSPDGTQVAAMQRLEDLQAAPTDRLHVAASTRRRSLVLVDLRDGAVATPCPDCDLAPHLIAWSPDSREVLVFGRPRDQPRETAGYLRLSRTAGPRPVDLHGLTPVIDRTSEGYEIPRAGWLAGAPLILAKRPDGARADWYRLDGGPPVPLTRKVIGQIGPLAGLEPDDLALLAGGWAWRVEASGETHRLFRAVAVLPPAGLGLSSRLRVNAPPSQAWFQTRPGPTHRLAIRSLDARRTDVAAPGGPVVAFVAGSSGLAVVRRAAEGPLTLELAGRTSSSRNLLTLNEGLLGVDFARVLPLSGRGPDGEILRHFLLMPPGPAAARRPPLIVVPYPGLVSREPPAAYGRGVGRFMANPEILAAGGYAVLVPSLPRTPGAEPGAAIGGQILAAVDLATATGLVDGERIGLVGQSFGGYASLMAAAQSDRFRSVVASAAPSDLAAVYTDFSPHLSVLPQDGIDLNSGFGWAERGQGGLGVAPWEDPERYRRNSPIYQADQIKASVLLIHGDSDFIRLSQAQRMFAALYRQGKDAELLTVYGEGHIVSSPANLREVYRRIFDWLAATL